MSKQILFLAYLLVLSDGISANTGDFLKQKCPEEKECSDQASKCTFCVDGTKWDTIFSTSIAIKSPYIKTDIFLNPGQTVQITSDSQQMDDIMSIYGEFCEVLVKNIYENAPKKIGYEGAAQFIGSPSGSFQTGRDYVSYSTKELLPGANRYVLNIGFNCSTQLKPGNEIGLKLVFLPGDSSEPTSLVDESTDIVYESSDTVYESTDTAYGSPDILYESLLTPTNPPLAFPLIEQVEYEFSDEINTTSSISETNSTEYDTEIFEGSTAGNIEIYENINIETNIIVNKEVVEEKIYLSNPEFTEIENELEFENDQLEIDEEIEKSELENVQNELIDVLYKNEKLEGKIESYVMMKDALKLSEPKKEFNEYDKFGLLKIRYNENGEISGGSLIAVMVCLLTIASSFVALLGIIYIKIRKTRLVGHWKKDLHYLINNDTDQLIKPESGYDKFIQTDKTAVFTR